MSMTRREMELKLEAKRRGLSLTSKSTPTSNEMAEEVSSLVDNQPEKGYWTQTAENFPGSAKGVYEDYKHLVTHPLETINTIGEAALGGVENIAESMGWEKPTGENISDVGRATQEGDHQAVADAIGEFYKERYGSMEAIKDTVKTDPAGAMLDISGVASVGGGALRAVPGMAKAGRGVQNVAAAMDPVNLAIEAVKSPYTIGRKAIPKSVKAATVEAVANILPRHRLRSGKVLNELAGGKAPEIIKALEAQKEIIPGSQPTSIQAGLRGGRVGPGDMGPPTPPVTKPQFAALDKPMQRRHPTTYQETKDAQRVARVRSIEDNIAKTPAERKVLVKARNDATTPMYAAARNDPNPVNIQPTLSKIDQILEDNPARPLVQKTFRKIRNSLTEKLDDGSRVPVTNAKHVISGIEGFKDLFASAKKKNVKLLLQDTKISLMNDVPLYKMADARYRELSRPINQVDIGTYMADAIRPFKGEVEDTSKYLRSVENAKLSIKNSLGEPRYKDLSEVLDPPQMEVLDLAKKEINRDAVISAHGSKGYGRMADVLESALDPVELPGMLSSKMMIARNIMARLKGHGTAKTMEYLADRQFSPKEWAKIMREATPKEKTILSSGEAFRNRALINQALFQSGRLGQENQ